MAENKKDEKIVFCTGGGCTAKLGAGVLSHILEKLPRGEKDPDLLVGYDSRDDAAVYRITDDIALVQTVDFFPPMVDDPYTFGLSRRQTCSGSSWRPRRRPSRRGQLRPRGWPCR